MRKNYVSLMPSRSVDVHLPKNLVEEEINYFQTYTKQTLPECRLYTLENVSLTAEGYIIKGLSALEDSFILTRDGYLGVYNWKGILNLLLRSKKQNLPGEKSYVVAHNFFSGYFHWIAESLPRLFLIKEQIHDLVLLMPESYSASFYEESARLLGIKTIYRLKKKVSYKVPKLVFPSVVAAQQSYDPEIIQQLRKYLVEKTKSTPSPVNNPKIYISRARAARRKVLNEEEVVRFLQQQGFTCIQLEEYSFKEQIRICNQAKMLIGIHGAGLTNIMFMDPGTKVLELRKFDKGEMYYYYSLASAAQVDYYYQFCQSNEPEKPVMTADIYVDIDQLATNLALMSLNNYDHC